MPCFNVTPEIYEDANGIITTVFTERLKGFPIL
jgi:hypothetical protein